MPSLLTIPRELRDKILNLIVSPFIPAPQTISDAGKRALLDDFPFCGYSCHSGSVFYVEHPKRTDTASLLLVNHQLHIETLDAIRILPTKHSYMLDVVIHEEKGVVPTWIYVPALTTRVDRVYTQIRSIGFPSQDRWTLFRGGCGGPPALTWAFYNLIERFVKVGPVGRRANKEDKRISIKDLIIDVRTPDVAPELIAPAVIDSTGGGALCFGENAGRQYSSRDTFEFPVMRHPKSIAAYISSDFHYLLMMCGDRGMYGGIIYERIGSIKVLVDGEPFDDDDCPFEWDIADCLAKMKYSRSWGNFRSSDPQDERKKAYKKWLEQVYKSRVELGLPVKPNEEALRKKFCLVGVNVGSGTSK